MFTVNMVGAIFVMPAMARWLWRGSGAAPAKPRV
jgi:hypothetical protein